MEQGLFRQSEMLASESIIVGTFQPEPRSVPCLAVFTAALIRDTLRDNSIELLSDACCRPRWRVLLADSVTCKTGSPCVTSPTLATLANSALCSAWVLTDRAALQVSRDGSVGDD